MTEELQAALEAYSKLMADASATKPTGVSEEWWSRYSAAAKAIKPDAPRGQRGVAGQAAATGNEYVIKLYGPIRDWALDDFNYYVEQAGSKKLRVRIASPGGDADVGLLMYNMLRKRGEVCTETDGPVASIASIVFLGGGERLVAREATTVMVHNAWVTAAFSGSATGWNNFSERVTKALAYLDQGQISALAARTEASAAKVAQWLAEETYFTPQQCIDLGIATGFAAYSDEEEDSGGEPMAAKAQASEPTTEAAAATAGVQSNRTIRPMDDWLDAEDLLEEDVCRWEFMIPDGTDVKAAKALLAGKAEDALRKQSDTLLGKLTNIRAEGRIEGEGEAPDTFDWQRCTDLNGSDGDRRGTAMRMRAERKAIRDEIAERTDRALIEAEIEFGNASTGNAYTDAPQGQRLPVPVTNIEVSRPQAILNIVQASVNAALTEHGGEAGNYDLLFRSRRKLTLEGLQANNLLEGGFGVIGNPQAATMTQGGQDAGFHPFSYRDLEVRLMTRQINNYTGILQRRSTMGQNVVNYLQEDDRTDDGSSSKENPAAAPADIDFHVNEKTANLRKIAVKAKFTKEELFSGPQFLPLLTERLMWAAEDKLETQLISGTDAGDPAQLRGINTQFAGAAQTADSYLVDDIETKIAITEERERPARGSHSVAARRPVADPSVARRR